MKHTHDEARDQHGNPYDKDVYIQRLLSTERDAWQMPNRVVRALGIKKGQTLAEIGAGPGYFTLRLARAAGKKGWVLAVEVDHNLIGFLRDRLMAESITNVSPIFGSAKDPYLPLGACDYILAVNVFHHFKGLPVYLRRLKASLKPDGKIAVIDFHKRELPVGPPVAHKMAREKFIPMAEQAGLKLIAEHEILPYQYFLIISAK